MSNTISREEIKHRLETGKPITLVEALPAMYFLDKHLPSAINIPHDEIELQAATRLPNRSAFIVVYCVNTSCRNSELATRTLEKLGYEQVFEFVEGKEGWEEAGYAFESGEEATASAA